MRRPLLFLAVVLCLLMGLPARPHGQHSATRPPTLSADLLGPRVTGDRLRVIVQGPAGGAATALRGRLRGIVRRELKGAVALEVSRADLDALSRDTTLAHISADSTVTSDMAITNQVKIGRAHV